MGALSIVPGTRSRTGFTLEWSAPTDNGGSAIIAYELTEFTNSTRPLYFGSLTATTLSTEQTSASLGEIGIYKIRAINLAGVGPWSDGYAFTIAGAPRAPLNLALVAAIASSIKISWQAPVDNGGDALTAYNIYRQRNGFSDI